MKRSREHLLTVIVRAFSAEARVVEVEWLAEFDLMISWPWEHCSQPSKDSKTVHVSLQKEAIEFYRSASAGMRDMADARLERHLQARLKRHPIPLQLALNQFPALVRWQIGTETLWG